jgi:23S rRNA G2445 N2-methylase RlmL
MSKSRILITCARSIPSFLKQELERLRFPILAEAIAGIETEGTLEDAMRLNLALRTGHRVLYTLNAFSAQDPEALYREVKRVPWESFIPSDGYVCVTAAVDMPGIRDTRYAGLKCKDAIVDRIKEQKGRRPDSGPERDRSVVHLFWSNGRAAVYLDTSGEPLSRRGYRKIPLAAPMQETLAAAVIMATGWSGEGHFVNPLCGSGTLAIEAALIALDRAPGLLRGNFGFMHVPGFPEAVWREMREDARKASRKDIRGRIIATDINPEAVEAAKKNATTAGVDHLIEFSVCDFAETTVPEGGGVVVMNPEYGERMGDVRQLEAVYTRIGDFLKQRCTGYRGYVFTGNLDLTKKIGLRTKRRMPFWNSGIECRLLEFDLYAGSKRATRAEGTSG